ncbi:unnamed protein product [Adineta ricciae]|nr:unnamed protein product [Adineta ricciae]
MELCPNDPYCTDTTREHWKKYRHHKRHDRKIIRVYHGTLPKHADSINKHGLRPSTEGRLGPGIYLAEKSAAKKISQYNSDSNDSFVVEAELNVGHKKVLTGDDDDGDGQWYEEGYDTCQAEHYPWAGNNHKFPEWCVQEQKRVKIVKYHQHNGKTNFEQAPRYPLNIKGKGKTKIKHKELTIEYDSDCDNADTTITIK